MKKWLIVVIIAIGLLSTAISQYKSILTSYAEFFTVNNAISGADAIVVLSGGKATRIPHALKLFAQGYATRLLLTDEKKRNIRFAHLFSTNEEIAQAMIEELKLNVQIKTVSSLKKGENSLFLVHPLLLVKNLFFVGGIFLRFFFSF